MPQINSGAIEQYEWLHESKKLADLSNLICLTKDEFKTIDHNPLIWFGTNLTQFLASTEDSEVCPLFGKQINNIDDFTYQLCRTIPWAFEMGRDSHAIYDVILNFTTQPKNRYFIWYDTQHLFRSNRELFDEIFESMIVASYLNSYGKATHNYQVNQKVIFLFDHTNEEDILELLNKKFYTPSIFEEYDSIEECYMIHEQTLVTIK